MDSRAQGIQERVQSLEDIVDGRAVAATIPPTTDDPFVVSVDTDVLRGSRLVEEGTDEELKGDCLKPTDITDGTPAREEAPSPPVGDARAHESQSAPLTKDGLGSPLDSHLSPCRPSRQLLKSCRP